MRKYFILSAITALIPMLYALPGESQTTSTTSSTTTVSKTRPVLRIRKRAPRVRRVVQRAAVNRSTSTSASTSATANGSSVKVKTETSVTK